MEQTEVEYLAQLVEVEEWYKIAFHKYLTVKFMKKHATKLDWYWITLYQKLPEKIIQQFINSKYISNNDRLKMCWNNVFMFQLLSEQFIYKNRHYSTSSYLSHEIKYNVKDLSNYCKICNSNDYQLYTQSCSEVIMDTALR